MTGAASPSKAEPAYWEGLWSSEALPPPLDLDPRLLRTVADRAFDRHLSDALAAVPPHGAFLEVGCARSQWLPHVAAQYGLAVTGLDYSETGCRQADAMLRRAGVAGLIVQGDLFEPPPALLGRFDAILTNGLVEHFPQTDGCLAALARFLRPGGVLITWIPNMAGIVGLLTRFINRPVYDRHVALDRTSLEAAHRAAGLDAVSCHYLLPVHMGVVNIANLKGTPLHGILARGLMGLSKLAWLLDDRLIALPRTRFLAPYVVATARRPAS